MNPTPHADALLAQDHASGKLSTAPYLAVLLPGSGARQPGSIFGMHMLSEQGSLKIVGAVAAPRPAQALLLLLLLQLLLICMA